MKIKCLHNMIVKKTFVLTTVKKYNKFVIKSIFFFHAYLKAKELVYRYLYLVLPETVETYLTEMKIDFQINGTHHRVCSKKFSLDTTLNSYIRNQAKLTGTKFMCLEGGCGACVVSIKQVHPVSKKIVVSSINSCLRPLFSCHDLEILTIEGIGDKKNGYHPLQNKLNEKFGSQCGFCSPGMIMNMYSFLDANNSQQSKSMNDLEILLGGNICRCTGYRPILDAFRSFVEINDQEPSSCPDIEELSMYCIRKGVNCLHKLENGMCKKVYKQGKGPLKMVSKDGREWTKVYKLDDLLNIVQRSQPGSYKLVAGNTAKGLFNEKPVQIFIDVNDVPELREYDISNELKIGANVHLTELINILENASKQSGFEYCQRLADHIKLVANVHVRNVGTIAGNLNLKKYNPEFQSDIFLLLETVQASLTVIDAVTRDIQSMSALSYQLQKLNKKVLITVKLPKMDPSTFLFRSYKIMPRALNALAYVNAGFLIELSDTRVKQARIVFGGINPEFVHASNTENLLLKKDLHNNETIQAALACLNNEIKPDWILPATSATYRKELALALFYRFVLDTCPADKVTDKYRSGALPIQRPLSTGISTFDTDKNVWPINEPVLKYEGLIQCSGEAKYSNDIPPMANELWAAFVTAKKLHTKIGRIDASEALKIPGVHHFFSAKDIPGKNSFTPTSIFTVQSEELFLGNGKVLFYDQPVGVILADTLELANFSATKVHITYESNYDTDGKALLTMAKSIAKSYINKSTDKSDKYSDIKPTLQNSLNHFRKTPKNSVQETNRIKGMFDFRSQYHFHMETQTCICRPAEDGIDVFSATQFMDYTQAAIADCLNIPENKVNIKVRRLGGSYGGKVTRASQIACAAALACQLKNQPIRFVMTLESNMRSIGKRSGLRSTYEVDTDSNGRINNFNHTYVQDCGSSLNDLPLLLFDDSIGSCYDTKTWKNSGRNVCTNAPSHTLCRAPGTLNGIAVAENIMEHIAWTLNLDSVSVRKANLSVNSPINDMLSVFLNDTDYYGRKKNIDNFNSHNRWRKRGISLVPIQYSIFPVGSLQAYVAIYHNDGTVAISHAGIEMGQGLNTKAAQIAAYTLGIPLNMISIKPANILIGANSGITGNSVTTDQIGTAIKKACEELNDRIKPIRDKMPVSSAWADITKACYDNLIDLTAKYSTKQNDVESYNVFGLACTEVEVDVLTGNLQITRVDLLEDTGQSLSPMIDVGQIQGAFTMGLGYWLTENLIYDIRSGELLTNRTTNYWPPSVRDIPVDFRVTLWQQKSNPNGVLGSKGVGEPALCTAVSVLFALRQAINSARKDANQPPEWISLDSGTLPDIIFEAAANNFKDYIL